MNTLAEKERALDELAQEIYADSDKIIEPLYPWILVRIMPKEQYIGGILLPEKTNRIFYEGIVLATWVPFWKHYQGKVLDQENIVERQILMESKVQRGDRVIFMHFEGQPYPYLDEIRYRMIHEIETHPNGGIWGKLKADEDSGLKEKLDKIFAGKGCLTVSGK